MYRIELKKWDENRTEVIYSNQELDNWTKEALADELVEWCKNDERMSVEDYIISCVNNDTGSIVYEVKGEEIK